MAVGITTCVWVEPFFIRLILRMSIYLKNTMRLNLYFSIFLSLRDFLVLNGDEVSDGGNGPGQEWRATGGLFINPFPDRPACFVQVILTRASQTTVSGFSVFVLEDNKVLTSLSN